MTKEQEERLKENLMIAIAPEVTKLVLGKALEKSLDSIEIVEKAAFFIEAIADEVVINHKEVYKG